MKGFDAFAGVIKSGGKTRRAAKMVILNVDHPDIVEFIDCKMKEERKAQVLIEQGYDPSIDGEAYGSVFFQNANHSVRVTDEFMQAVEEDRDWWTRNVNDGKPVENYSARDLLQEMADSAWHCGDPGMQYDTTVNRWHTCKNTARINASNPCSEYMFLDDTACNLASINLMKFLGPNGQFDVERSATPWMSPSPRRKSWSTTPAIRRRRSRKLARLPPARPRLRQPRRAADGHGAAVRFRRRPRHGRRDHRADVRRGL